MKSHRTLAAIGFLISCLPGPLAASCTSGVVKVTSTADSGAGSLRAAIEQLNACSGTQAHEIHFEIPGDGDHVITVSSPLPAIQHKTFLDGSKMPQYVHEHGTLKAPKVYLQASATVIGSGLVLNAAGCHVKALGIAKFPDAGILIRRGDAIVEGCYIGTSPSGDAANGNGYGIQIENAGHCRIGGTTGHEANVLSGNFVGILITGSSSTFNVVEGNFIGTNPLGSIAVGNRQGGIQIHDGASDNRIGGHDPGARNLISGNSNNTQVVGVRIGDPNAVTAPPPVRNVIQGNRIGTDVDGEDRLQNDIGVMFFAAGANTLGGTTQAEGNLIAGNRGEQVHICASTDVAVLSNTIGIGIPKAKDQHNVDVPNPLGSLVSYGVFIGCGGTSRIVVGAPGSGNKIAYSFLDGVIVNNVKATTVRGNSIYSNTKLGIAQADQLAIAPALTGIGTHSHGDGGATVSGTLNTFGTAKNATFHLDFFSSSGPCDTLNNRPEGEHYVGTMDVTTDGSGNASFTYQHHEHIPKGRYVTATASRVGVDALGVGYSTSAFSTGCLAVP